MNTKPYNPVEKAFENIMTIINEDDYIIADVYSEQLDLKYTVSGITLDNLISMFKADKHLYIESICIVRSDND